MPGRTAPPARWHAAIVVLHWTMAAVLAGGLAMTRAADRAAETGDFSVTVAGLPIYDAYQLALLRKACPGFTSRVQRHS